jgi:ABC-type transport system substrate-binding protein
VVYAPGTTISINDPGGMLMSVGPTSPRAHRAGWLTTLAVIGAVAVFAAGCGGGDSASDTTQPPGTFSAVEVDEDVGPPQSGGVLAFGLTAETDGYEPSSSRWAASGYIVAFSIFDPLTAYSADLDVEPYLAKSMEHNDDFTEWRIGVRPGVTFHDGTEVDAAAIADALTADKASPLAGTVFEFANTFVPSPDGTEVVVEMNKPWSTFPQVLTAQTGVIRAPSMATDPEAARNPVGSGPFIFESWEQGNELKVKKNPNYWRAGLPYLDNIEFKVISDVQARGSTFETGGVDIFETSDPQQIIQYTEAAKEDEEVQIFTSQLAEGTKTLMALNLAAPPFDDPLARQAVAYGIDTASLSEGAFSGIFPPVDGPFSKNSPFYVPDHGYPEFDTAKAKELNDEYQEKHGEPLTFSFAVLPSPESQAVGQTIQAQLAEAGIQMSVVTKEQATLLADIVLGNYEASGFALFGSPSIDREYVFFAGPAKPVDQFSVQVTRISDEENAALRAAMDKGRTTDDPAIIKEQYEIVQREMAKNLNFLFLVQATGALVFNGDVHGALEWNLPNAEGGEGTPGQVSVVPFTANIWLGQ